MVAELRAALLVGGLPYRAAEQGMELVGHPDRIRRVDVQRPVDA